jgi:hypothetical protein
MIIIVCGPRDWKDFRMVGNALDEVVSRAKSNEPITVLDGGAKGADFQAHYYAEMMGWNTQQYKPQYEDGYPQKFFIRNQKMADHQPKPDACIAMIGKCEKTSCPPWAHITHGTADMITRAKRNGIEVIPFGDVALYVSQFLSLYKRTR